MIWAQRRAHVAVLLLLPALVLAACHSATEEDAGPMSFKGHLTDFATVQPPDSPNTWLVAPPGLGRATPNEIAPEFDVDAARLVAAWRAVLTVQPRTTIVGTSSDGLQVEAEQRSAVFGFVDDVSFRAIPGAAGRSTLAVYSRSRVGYWDMGVNRRRVRAWVDQLQQRVAANLTPGD